MKRITFLLSGTAKYPIGGFRIVYEYANRLDARGWHVTVIHPAVLFERTRPTFLKRCRRNLGFIREKVLGSYLPKSWFAVNRGVRMVWVPNLSSKYIPDADYVVACPVESAMFAKDYPPNKGAKFYFIQHFEEWNLSKEEVEATWKFPLTKIVIARWLSDIGDRLGQKTIYIPNGLEFSFFRVTRPPAERSQKSLVFMYHSLAWKGSRFALAAVRELRTMYPDFAFKAFSVSEKPTDFPDFVEFVHNPSQEDLLSLYNSSAIFLSPSLTEGWGLTPAEAMLCGCVVVATDIGGHREFLVDGENGFLCEPGSVSAIVEKVQYIVNHPEVSLSVASRAPVSLRKFDWDSRVDLFEAALLENAR